MLYWLKSGQVTSRQAIAKRLGLDEATDEATVTRWLRRYKDQGRSGLLCVKHDLGKKPIVSGENLESLNRRLSEPEGFQSYDQIQQWLISELGLNIAYKTVYQLVRYQLGAKLKVPRPKSADALGRTVSIVFLTDGLEDVRGIPNPISIPSNTQLLPDQQCKPYIFFVSLRLKEHEKQLNDFASNPALCGKGQVLRDPGGVELNKLAENIRPVLITPKLEVNLPTANLQPVLPETTTEPLNINGISNVNSKVSLQLENPQQSSIRLIPSDRTIELVANQATVIPVRLEIPAEAKRGASSLRLVLSR
ncbi:helix-turn-helix domain-containing protein [Nostoc sp.]|uniref:helix-turn-helix domain-containing protein n=1 Tax=Nostoc sp. TaxID=1180 RepID=UPI002FF4D12A